MKKKKRLAREQLQAEDKTPTEEDWLNTDNWNYEVEYAFEKFYKKPLNEIYSHFENALTISETLGQLPEIPMRYYFSLYLHYVIHDREQENDDPGRACAAFYACLYGFDLNKDVMLKVMPDLLPQLQFIAENQDLFDKSGYGGLFDVYDFKEDFEKVLKRYSEAQI